MKTSLSAALAFGACLAIQQFGSALPAAAADMKVISDDKMTGFVNPESVGCDLKNKVLYVSEFGSELKPTQKDGKGRITKVSLDRKIIEQGYFPAKDQVLNKPKGIWISGNNLWVTDIDAVWQFDTKTKAGKKLDLPGAQFANDPTVIGKTLYVSDNRGDQLFKVEPADFLKAKKPPKVTVAWKGKSVNPNGLYPGKGGMLLLAGFESKEKPHAIFSMAPGKDPKAVTGNIGRLDGLYQTKDGRLMATDWDTGSLFVWNDKQGMQKLATGFKGPADFCVMPNAKGLLVVVPDLVASELRFIQLGK